MEICRGVLLQSLAEYYSAYACEATIQVWRKNHPKGLEVKVPGTRIEPGTVPDPSSQLLQPDWKIS